MFPEPLYRSSTSFSYVFFVTVYPATPEPIDHSTLLQDVISDLGVHQEGLDGIASSQKHFYHVFSADIFAALTYAFYIWDNYIWLVITACPVAVTGCPLIGAYLLLLFDVNSG